MFFNTSTYFFTESQNTSLSWTGAYPLVFLLYFPCLVEWPLGVKKNKSNFRAYCEILLKEMNQSRSITCAILFWISKTDHLFFSMMPCPLR